LNTDTESAVSTNTDRIQTECLNVKIITALQALQLEVNKWQQSTATDACAQNSGLARKPAPLNVTDINLTLTFSQESRA